MIELKEIKTKDHLYYKYVEELMLSAFPENERRDQSNQREYTDNNSKLHCNVVTNDSEAIGLVNYWRLGKFYYIEHIAIDPHCRNGGHGKVVIEKIKEICHDLPIILEVERPEDEMSCRRINFYQRSGFALHELDYIQPPYRVGGEEVPLYLMSYGTIDMEAEWENVTQSIHQEVYNKQG
ncbi:MAG: GNAT family N-acetyltransferase [Phocaeicola sp.]